MKSRQPHCQSVYQELILSYSELSEKHRCIRACGYTLLRTPSKLRPRGNTYMLFDQEVVSYNDKVQKIISMQPFIQFCKVSAYSSVCYMAVLYKYSYLQNHSSCANRSLFKNGWVVPFLPTPAQTLKHAQKLTLVWENYSVCCHIQCFDVCLYLYIYKISSVYRTVQQCTF